MLDTMTFQSDTTAVVHGAEHLATLATAFLSTGVGGSVLAWLRLRSQMQKLHDHHTTLKEIDGTRMDRLEKDLTEMKTAMKIVVAKFGRLQLAAVTDPTA